MSQTVAILPGILSGPHTTRRLCRLLNQAGLQITSDAAHADVLIAHSAGPLWLPKTAKDQLFVIVNPPYWPGRSIRERAHDRLRSNFQFRKRGIPLRRWLSRQFWGIYYVFRNPRRTYYVLRHIADYDLRDSLKHHRVLLVRNEQDDWLTPDLAELKRDFPELTITRLTGDHDDFNYNPERYVELLQLFTEGGSDE